MYKLLPQSQEQSSDRSGIETIIRISDNAFIPFDPDNTDYQEYLKWLEVGNTPEPADQGEQA